MSRDYYHHARPSPRIAQTPSVATSYRRRRISAGDAGDVPCMQSAAGRRTRAPGAVPPPSAPGGGGGAGARFSQLLLEAGEVHIHDWAAVATRGLSRRGAVGGVASGDVRTFVTGRLRLCSRSTVFEPDDHTRGIIRLPFRRCDRPLASADADGNGRTVAIHSTRHFVMKENNATRPFAMVDAPAEFRFEFQHSSPAEFLRQADELHATTADPRVTTADAAASLARMLQPRLAPAFDPSNFVDVRERPRTAGMPCCLISPLLSNPGCCLATDKRIYFQPAEVNNVGQFGASWALGAVTACARRYKGLNDCAIEIFFIGGDSVLIAFDTRGDRERLFRCLPDTVCHTDRGFVAEAGKKWGAKTMSNYSYLLALNSAAGRSFHDLSRYPVYPWVVADYSSTTLDLENPNTFRDLSKPVGALNKDRLDYYLERLTGMQGTMEPFLYGTHYSAPGYVLYYLIRTMPEHMLCLQNGKFDAPDRMFHSIEKTYESVLINHTDVKELIPEFYDASGSDFLINAQGLDLGSTQNGVRVHDVHLPVWARSPRDFIKKNRAALESQICTNRLPEWINLTFGVKSRGVAARDANNLFYKTAYLTPANVEAMESPDDVSQAELQASEFGICPDVLFVKDHPARSDGDDIFETAAHIAADSARAGLVPPAEQADVSSQQWEMVNCPSDGGTNGSRSRTSSLGSRSSMDSSFGSRSRVDSESSFGSVSVTRSRKKIDSVDNSLDRRGTPSRGQAVNILKRRPVDPPQKRISASLPTKSVGNGSATVIPVPAPVPAPASVSVPAPSSNFNESILGAKAWLKGIVGRTSKEEQLEQLDDGVMVEANGADKMKLSNSGQSLSDTTQLGRRVIRTFSSLHNDKKTDIGIDVPDEHTSADSKRTARGRNLIGSPASPSSLFDVELKILVWKRIHNDSVSSCCLSVHEGGRTLASCSRDGTVKVCEISVPGDRRDVVRLKSRGPSLRVVRSQFLSNMPLSSVVLADDGYGGRVVVAGGYDCVLTVLGTRLGAVLRSFRGHGDTVSGVDVIGCTDPLVSTHSLVTAGWDATVKVWPMDFPDSEQVDLQDPVELFDADSPITSVSANVHNVGRKKRIAICAGCEDGFIIMWLQSDTGSFDVVYKHMTEGSSPCTVVKFGACSGSTSTAYVAFHSGRIIQLRLHNSSVEVMGSMVLNSQVLDISVQSHFIFAGCDDGSLRVIYSIPSFTSCSPVKILPALHGGKSPGIRAISSVRIMNSGYFCATGADDGSVLVFELTQKQ